MVFAASYRELQAGSPHSPDRAFIPTVVWEPGGYRLLQRDPSLPQLRDSGVTVFALHLIQKTHFYLRNVCLDC
jgi:hypothetical protein